LFGGDEFGPQGLASNRLDTPDTGFSARILPHSGVIVLDVAKGIEENSRSN
jgi:hypothetical protein